MVFPVRCLPKALDLRKIIIEVETM